ncbi:MAG: geranylgeranylglycerol-phosphate geranylgeranyltransferase [Candidatus Lokiarchaeota archaeon]|nr:geranylgeranylglycerol-phosphate geranylgeranyltransferase [Candidatus Lokiarchaeota archaeon]
MKVKDIVEIMRPINDVMGSLTVIIGVLNTRMGIPDTIVWINLIMGVLTYIFISGASMIINDIYDHQIDQINRPERPIPSGRISLKQAKILFVVMLVIGITFSFLNSLIIGLIPINVIVAAFFGFIGWLYAKWGKKSGFPGNILVGISFSIGLVYGAILNGYNIPLYILYFFLTSFFLLIAREIVKGCEDIEGDKIEGVKTLALTKGLKYALVISVICQILAIVFFILPIFTLIINPMLFLLTMSFGLVVVCIALVLSLLSKLEKKEFSRISLFLKIGAFLGLLSFVCASIG